MILHAIELSYVGPFRETVRLGPFESGLNLLCAPNETGKSTSLRATARALFDKHTTKGDELKSLQPAGTDLAPRVMVEFETRAGRFRVEKTFLLTPRSVLQQLTHGTWQPIAEADAADQRLQLLLHSTLPGRGATRPEHWGFLGFLWARQGEVSEWPRLDDETVGQKIRARLARVELDPVIEQLRSRLAIVADGIVTATGQSRAGGPLRQAEEDLAAIERELTKLREKRAELEAAHQRYERAITAVAQLEKEHAEREAAARTLAEQALASERLRGELKTREAEFASAQQKLNAMVGDAAALARRQNDLTQTREALSKAETTAHAATSRLAEIRGTLDRQQADRSPLETELTTLRAALQRTQNLLRLRQLASTARSLAKQVTKAETAAAQLNSLVAARARLPALTPARVRRLEELTEQLRTQRAQLEARGLTVELTPGRDATATIREGNTASETKLPAGAPTRLQRPQFLDLELQGWGRITIRSGAREAQNLAQELAATESALQMALQEAAVPTLEAARESLALRKELDAQIEIARAAATEQLGEHATLEALRVTATSAAHRVDAQIQTLQPTAIETERQHVELESDEVAHAVALRAAEKRLIALDQSLAQLRSAERIAAEALHKAESVAGDQRARLRALESQVTELVARHPQGIDTAKAHVQIEFAQAEARVAAARANLPPDFEKLPERNRAATAVLQQLVSKLQAARSDRDNAHGALEILGGQGIYSRETELEEKKAEAILRRDAARTKGWAARLAHTLIDYRKQAATKAVLTPLEQRLSAAFAELTDDRTRKVFLDEHLQIAGIGRTREASHPFEQLSQGAKEQLLLCLRIAVAQELAAAEPQVLILDDVLVNTDSVRQDRILDVLTSVATQLQVIVLTCHAERYQRVGRALSFTPVPKA